MRITGGQWAGLPLQRPKGPAVRSTLDHVRQALFNILAEKVREAKVLDLFSGSGALGIEALSRGAAHVTFVDRSPFCIQAIRANLEALSLAALHPPPFTLHRMEALTAIRRLGKEGKLFDLILLDPPYGRGWVRISLLALIRCAIVTPTGIVVVEQEKRDPLFPRIEAQEGRLTLQRHQRYGDSVLAFYLGQ